MKKIKLLTVALIFALVYTSCENEDGNILTGNENVGGLAKVNSALIGYVVGNGNTFQYNASFSVTQGAVRTNSVDIYKSFTNSLGKKSNEVLLKTVTLSPSEIRETKNFTVTYNELIAGLSINGVPLSSNDATLNIGEFWTLRYVSNTSAGESHSNVSTTKVSVGTRFAGNYTVTAAEYYRIGVSRPDVAGPYVGTTIVIESINSTLYKINNYFGPFTGNELYFSIDALDKIDYPANKPDGSPQLGNGQPFISCATTSNELTNVRCSTSNFVTRDNVAGKDQLTMSFGYLNAPGASREFYQVLKKQ